MNIKNEITNKYLNYYFQYYHIIEERQPNLRNAICQVCENPDLKIDAIQLGLNIEDLFLVQGGFNSRSHISEIDEHIKTLEDLVLFFSNLVRYQEGRKIGNFEYFELEEKVARLEKKLDSSMAPYKPYR